MSQPDDFIQSIFHLYSPVDRHERYLRERQLKGRQPAKKMPTVGKIGTLHPKGKATRPATKGFVKSAVPKKSAAEVRKETLAQVEALKARFEKLREVLRQLVEQAQARAGDHQLTTQDKVEKPSHTTAAEKKKAAEASQKSRDKHKNDPPTPSEELKTLQTKIKNIQKKIEEMRAKLNEALPAPSRIQTQDRVNTPLRKPGTVGVGTKQRTREENSQNGRS